MWAYEDPPTRLSVLYHCLPGYRHTGGELGKTCDIDRMEWVPTDDIICEGKLSCSICSIKYFMTIHPGPRGHIFKVFFKWRGVNVEHEGMVLNGDVLNRICQTASF